VNNDDGDALLASNVWMERCDEQSPAAQLNDQHLHFCVFPTSSSSSSNARASTLPYLASDGESTASMFDGLDPFSLSLMALFAFVFCFFCRPLRFSKTRSSSSPSPLLPSHYTADIWADEKKNGNSSHNDLESTKQWPNIPRTHFSISQVVVYKIGFLQSFRALSHE
jgi:hypothetical protein